MHIRRCDEIKGPNDLVSCKIHELDNTSNVLRTRRAADKKANQDERRSIRDRVRWVDFNVHACRWFRVVGEKQWSDRPEED
jgi:hypothetical protein